MKNKIKNICLSLAIVSLISVPILMDHTIIETKATSSINLNEYNNFDTTFTHSNFFECSNTYANTRLRVDLRYYIEETLYFPKDENITTYYVKFNSIILGVDFSEYVAGDVNRESNNFTKQYFNENYYNCDVLTSNVYTVFEEVQMDDTFLTFNFRFYEGVLLETKSFWYDYYSPEYIGYDGNYTYDFTSALSSFNNSILTNFRNTIDEINNSYNNGYHDGFIHGNNAGYNEGYTQGLMDERVTSRGLFNAFDLLKTSFDSLVSIFTIDLLPNISIGMLITIPFVVAIIGVAFKMLS